MKKFTYRLTALSSIIVSPRGSAAWYEDLGDFSRSGIKDDSNYLAKNKLKVIFPFYQYGEYNAYDPDSAEYYVPGTSVKGALCGGRSVYGGCMADDIPVDKSHIVLRNLYKAQYLNKEGKSACFKEFFENVGMEMIKASTELSGDIYLDDEMPEELLKAANKLTRVKMKQMLEYLQKLRQENDAEELVDKFKQAAEGLADLVNEDNIFLIGGYKGLLLAIERKKTIEQNNSLTKTDGAIFLDPEKLLPHGLVKIEFT